MTLRVLLVDDEPMARRRLAHLITRIGGVTIVGEAGDGITASAAIAQLCPDLVLLDIHMPGVDGITVADKLLRVPDAPLVIFVTADRSRAVAAFEAAALDYLLKPLGEERLATAFARASARLAERRAARREITQPGAAQLADALVPHLRVTVRAGGEVRFFDPRHITRLWSEDKYTVFRYDGVERLLDESLSVLEGQLAPLGFLRVHRGELIQLAAIRAVHAEGDVATVELVDGQLASVSRRSLPTLRRRIAER